MSDADWPWVFAAYALTWVVLGTYTWIVLRRRATARRELDAETFRTQRSTEMEP